MARSVIHTRRNQGVHTVRWTNIPTAILPDMYPTETVGSQKARILSVHPKEMNGK